MALVKTLIRNVKPSARKLTWVGRHGVFIAGGASLMRDEAYPTAIDSPAKLKDFRQDLADKTVELYLLTDIPVITEERAKEILATPPPQTPVAVLKKVKTPVDMPKTPERPEVLADGMESLLPPKITLFDKPVELPETRNIFPTGNALDKKEEPSPKLTEVAVESTGDMFRRGSIDDGIAQAPESPDAPNTETPDIETAKRRGGRRKLAVEV